MHDRTYKDATLMRNQMIRTRTGYQGMCLRGGYIRGDLKEDGQHIVESQWARPAV
jgi:hypothetical protein